MDVIGCIQCKSMARDTVVPAASKAFSGFIQARKELLEIAVLMGKGERMTMRYDEARDFFIHNCVVKW